MFEASPGVTEGISDRFHVQLEIQEMLGASQREQPPGPDEVTTSVQTRDDHDGSRAL
jgi:hypothetical protein